MKYINHIGGRSTEIGVTHVFRGIGDSDIPLKSLCGNARSGELSGTQKYPLCKMCRALLERSPYIVIGSGEILGIFETPGRAAEFAEINEAAVQYVDVAVLNLQASVGARQLAGFIKAALLSERLPSDEIEVHANRVRAVVMAEIVRIVAERKENAQNA